MPSAPSPIPPLRWGDAATRRWAGVWLIVGGGMSIAGSNTEALWVLAMGTVASVAGWCILPSAGWRRTLAVGPATFAMWLLLTGPRFVFVLVVPYLLWLLVQHRRGLSALTAIPVVVVAVLVGNALWHEDSGMLLALAIVGLAIVAADRLSRLFERRGRRVAGLDGAGLDGAGAEPAQGAHDVLEFGTGQGGETAQP